MAGEQGEGLFVLLPGCGGGGMDDRTGAQQRITSGGGVDSDRKEQVPELATQL